MQNAINVHFLSSFSLSDKRIIPFFLSALCERVCVCFHLQNQKSLFHVQLPSGPPFLRQTTFRIFFFSFWCHFAIQTLLSVCRLQLSRTFLWWPNHSSVSYESLADLWSVTLEGLQVMKRVKMSQSLLEKQFFLILELLNFTNFYLICIFSLVL